MTKILSVEERSAELAVTFCREFCKDTPRIKPESGVVFAQRLRSFAKLQFTQALTAEREAGAREEREKVIKLLKEAIPLHRIPSDCVCTPEAINNLMKLHFEPEHEEGVTCWCKPIVTVNHVDKKTYIDHNEQRVVIRDFLNANFVSIEEKISALSLGSNQARRAIINVVQALTPPTK